MSDLDKRLDLYRSLHLAGHETSLTTDGEIRIHLSSGTECVPWRTINDMSADVTGGYGRDPVCRFYLTVIVRSS